jgi:transcription elongation factor GreA
MATEKEYLTQERKEEFTKELAELKTTKRVEVAERLRRAKEYGDLSENSEYSEAREEQANVEARIFELEDLLKKAVIISKPEGGDMVHVGSTITVKKGEKTAVYTIVGSYEAKPEEGRISDESPLGKAFLGHKKGERVKVATPAGASVYEIVKIA